jgi:hypothetical protein
MLVFYLHFLSLMHSIFQNGRVCMFAGLICDYGLVVIAYLRNAGENLCTSLSI